MASTTTIFAKDFLPWSPDIDARRMARPGIITGTNFIDDVDGPRCAFSSVFFDYNLFDVATRRKVTQLPLADGFLYGTPTGVWRFNSSSGIAELLLDIVVDNEFWPWTIALVGGVYYLAQYNKGLWRFDPINETIEHVNTPAGDNISFVAASFGRLIYLTPTDVALSALDDGTDLEPSLTTGAGAQTLSMVGGMGLRIAPVSDGFLVYTTAGIMTGQFTQAAYVFSFSKLTEGIKLFSPNAGIYVPGIGDISLDASGFWLTNSVTKIPEPWEQEKSDYIKKNIFNTLNKKLFGTISMFFSIAEQKIYVGFSSNTTEGLVENTFVYTLISQRWGNFNIDNYGIFETIAAINNIYSCSYMSTYGYIKVFTNTDFSVSFPLEPFDIIDLIYRPDIFDMNIQQFIDGVTDTVIEVCFCGINISDNIPTIYKNYNAYGLYKLNDIVYSDTNNDNSNDPDFIDSDTLGVGTYINIDISGITEQFAVLYVLPSVGLNSQISLGPFRFTDQVQADQTSSVSSLILGLAQTSNFIITEDWNISIGNEDWNVLVGNEDWGAGNSTPNVFDLYINNTDDGVNPPVQGIELLPVFSDLGSALRYAPMEYSSIFHNLTLIATNPGEAYYVKYIDFAGQLTGRLQQS